MQLVVDVAAQGVGLASALALTSAFGLRTRGRTVSAASLGIMMGSSARGSAAATAEGVVPRD
ncbi:MAG TPA: hypothetical protein VLZ56_03285, partial [Mycoplana sp.]|nr:hypothetical protein [Mycoplana sp.]